MFCGLPPGRSPVFAFLGMSGHHRFVLTVGPAIMPTLTAIQVIISISVALVPDIPTSMAHLLQQFSDLPEKTVPQNRVPYVHQHEMLLGYLRPISASESITQDRIFSKTSTAPHPDYDKTSTPPLVVVV